MPKSLWGRLFGSYLVVVLLTVSVSGFLIAYLVENVVVGQRLRDLSRRASRIAQSFSIGDLGFNIGLRQWALLRQVVEDEFWVVNEEGVIVASSAPMARLVGRALPVDEWQRLGRGEAIFLRQTHNLLQAPYLLVGIPIVQRNKVIGAIYIHSPLAGIDQAMSEVRRTIALSGLAGVIGALLLSFWLARGMTAPLGALAMATTKLSRGDYTGSILPTGIAEIDSLGSGFNALRRNLATAVTQLAQEKEQAHGILQNMSEGVVLFGADGAVLHLNPVAKDLLNENQSSPELFRTLRQAWLSQGSEQVEEEVKLGERTLLVRASSLASRDKVWGAVAVLIDISARQQLEEARRGFVAVVSHELRTPLAHIQGYIEAVLDGVAVDEKTKLEYLHVALSETLRLGRISQDLLTLAQSDARTLSLRKLPLPLANYIEEVVSPWRLQAEKNGMSFVERVLATGSVSADPDRMKQVLDNLFENAFAYTNPGGEVGIVVEQDARQTVLTIYDTGCGIPSESLPYIWERFYRADSSRTRLHGGSGLGLAIVKELVELHEGKVSVVSTAGIGTRFTITLPLQD